MGDLISAPVTSPAPFALPEGGLRLMAQDGADLQIISALLQDGVGKVGDIHFDPKARTLSFELNRFVWEEQPEAPKGLWGLISGVFSAKRPAPRRVRSLLQIAEVTGVKAQGISPKAPLQVVSVLALTYQAEKSTDDGMGDSEVTSDQEAALPTHGVMRLIFAGGAELKVLVECLEVCLVDMNAAWEARSVPRHKAP